MPQRLIKLKIHISNAKGLKLPKTFNNDLELKGLKTIEGLELPEIVNGNLILYFIGQLKNNNFKELGGLKLPKIIKGDLVIDGINSLDGVLLPDKIEGYLEITDLEGKEKLEGINLDCIENKNRVRYKNKELEKMKKEFRF